MQRRAEWADVVNVLELQPEFILEPTGLWRSPDLPDRKAWLCEMQGSIGMFLVTAGASLLPVPVAGQSRE